MRGLLGRDTNIIVKEPRRKFVGERVRSSEGVGFYIHKDVSTSHRVVNVNELSVSLLSVLISGLCKF